MSSSLTVRTLRWCQNERDGVSNNQPHDFFGEFPAQRASNAENDSHLMTSSCAQLGAKLIHYDDVIMTMLASQITSLTVVYSIVYSGVNQRKHQSSASLAFVRAIHRGPVNFPHKWPVTRKMFPFDDVIMIHWWISSVDIVLGQLGIQIWRVWCNNFDNALCLSPVWWQAIVWINGDLLQILPVGNSNQNTTISSKILYVKLSSPKC